jgi:hypothetical protein
MASGSATIDPVTEERLFLENLIAVESFLVVPIYVFFAMFFLKNVAQLFEPLDRGFE